MPRKPHLNVPACNLPMMEEPQDFRTSFQWRVFRIMSEFIEGFQFIADYNKTVTVFGSARLEETNHWYQETRRLGSLLSKEGFNIITGGGPGIMEAANRGAFEDDGVGKSIGLNIQLPREQRINPYVETGHGFHYFFSRKVMLSYAAQAYVYCPGGFGTLDEFFEIVTLIQTNKIPNTIPVILIGKEFWSPLLEWIDKELVLRYKTISAVDPQIYQLVDTAEEAMEIIKSSPERKEF
ncbi:MAG: TIGR00730 family Rossman fold protein [Candidatus Harrisonbacteria bacterium CG10_big_fil_rev_8_21_14_0_10_38_8]|uniref:Cytokinin riboside 5'-monophosphate phosphoribohydrolase n=1 Tax=Candidatus Harrisonbacteria bacterium CG10_big_fil_rev_8_21_14_0_10_38_8 TaxID=1974582 RepID=A0A2M6WJQ2_9BACT|nr:MAG: TIGR00730 family Rossman fold protein [Candidatus Harrisonbacteria bacterium CG10_big_fil_rev_8_21_14_0_10_38_8]